MRTGLRRYWFRFDGDATYGYGVTAISREDALSQLGRVFDGPLPARRVETEDIDVSTLDSGHVLPNMGDPSIRGIWFPPRFASRGPRDDRSLAGTGPLHGRDIEDPWHLNEIARRRRVGNDAKRSLGANLSGATLWRPTPGGLRVRVCSLEALLAMNRASTRERLALLESAHGRDRGSERWVVGQFGSSSAAIS